MIFIECELLIISFIEFFLFHVNNFFEFFLFHVNNFFEFFLFHVNKFIEFILFQVNKYCAKPSVRSRRELSLSAC